MHLPSCHAFNLGHCTWENCALQRQGTQSCISPQSPRNRAFPTVWSVCSCSSADVTQVPRHLGDLLPSPCMWHCGNRTRTTPRASQCAGLHPETRGVSTESFTAAILEPKSIGLVTDTIFERPNSSSNFPSPNLKRSVLCFDSMTKVPRCKLCCNPSMQTPGCGRFLSITDVPQSADVEFSVHSLGLWMQRS